MSEMWITWRTLRLFHILIHISLTSEITHNIAVIMPTVASL